MSMMLVVIGHALATSLMQFCTFQTDQENLIMKFMKSLLEGCRLSEWGYIDAFREMMEQVGAVICMYNMTWINHITCLW